MYLEELRKLYPLCREDAQEILRFLLVFSVGCRKLKLDFYDKYLSEFLVDLSKMGYSSKVIGQLLRSVSWSVRLD